MPTLTIEKSPSKFLSYVKPFIKSKIYDTIMISKHKEGVKFVFCNSEVQIEHIVNGTLDDAEKVIVPYDFFIFIDDNYSNQQLEFEITNKITLKTSKQQYSKAIEYGEHYPTFSRPKEKVNRLELKATTLIYHMSKVMHAVNKDVAARPYLNAVVLDFSEDKLDFVATDTFRMALSQTDEYQAEGEEKKVIIPYPLASVLSKDISLTENVVIETLKSEGSMFLKVSFEKYLFTISTYDKYPDHKRFFQESFENKVVVDCRTLRDSVSRVVDFLNINKVKVKKLLFNFKENTLSISAKEDAISINEDIDCVGGNMEVCLNGEFVLDFLEKANSKEIEMYLNHPLKPVMFVSDYKETIMPMYQY